MKPLFEKLVSLCALLAGGLVALVCAVTFYEVISRYVFNAPTTWSLDISIYAMFWACFLGGAYTRDVSFWRYHGNRTLTRVSNLFTGLRLTDMETCYKLMRADVARSLDIQSRTFTVEPEMTAKFARAKLRVVEVPISYDSRGYDEGKKIGLKDAFLAIGAILRFRFFA